MALANYPYSDNTHKFFLVVISWSETYPTTGRGQEFVRNQDNFSSKNHEGVCLKINQNRSKIGRFCILTKWLIYKG